MKNKKIDVTEICNQWKEYLLSKGFKVLYEDKEVDKFGNKYISFLGCKPEIKVEIYAGNYRTDTKTGGCICADFKSSYNKVSQCPFYSDVTIKQDEFWSAIELLMNAGEDWSNHCGKLEKVGGAWICDPAITKKDKPKCIK